MSFPLSRRSTTGLAELEMVPLAERLRAMGVFRFVLAGLLIAAKLSIPGFVQGDQRTLVTVTLAYLVISTAGYLLWRLWPGRGLFLFSALLLLDGVFLAWATFAGGGVGSPVGYLLIAYVVVVTLVASYRTGLKLVLWESLLLLSGFHLGGTGLLPALGIQSPAQGGADYRRIILFVAGLWLVGIVTAMYSALNERELRRRRFDLTALTNMAGELERDMRPAAIAEVFLNYTIETFDFARGVVLAYSDYGRLTMLASHGGPGATAELAPTAAIERAWKMREPLLVRKVSEREDGPLSDVLPDARNLVIVPLIAEGSPIGVLVAEHGKPRIEQRALTILTQFASHASLALRNAWLLEEMRTMADRDPLTGVANRRSFDARLELEVKRAQRTNDPLSLLLLDLDHFKQVNDLHGHPAGDRVLRQVSATLASHAREIDMPARYGGEEFALILPSCSPEEAGLVAERLRRAISELRIDPGGPLTTSVGVASWPRNALDVRALVSASDEALYAAKRAGRNMVVTSDATVDELGPSFQGQEARALAS